MFKFMVRIGWRCYMYHAWIFLVTYHWLGLVWTTLRVHWIMTEYHHQMQFDVTPVSRKTMMMINVLENWIWSKEIDVMLVLNNRNILGWPERLYLNKRCATLAVPLQMYRDRALATKTSGKTVVATNSNGIKQLWQKTVVATNSSLKYHSWPAATSFE